jgi:hypothetical protein
MFVSRVGSLLATLLTAAAILDAAPAAAAARATEWSAQSTRPSRPRIEIRPGRLYHRECVDGLQQVSRPYWGRTVVMPYMRCWWVRG